MCFQAVPAPTRWSQGPPSAVHTRTAATKQPLKILHFNDVYEVTARRFPLKLWKEWIYPRLCVTIQQGQTESHDLSQM